MSILLKPALSSPQVEEVTERYTKNTIAVKRDIRGVVKVHSESEIKNLLKYANENNLKVWPLSSGKNWGYGSSSPVSNDNLILDLSKLNEIHSFDPANGIITLGPGVTQGQLYEFLKETNYLVPTTGAGPTVSVLANLLERGYGLTPIQDHFSSLISLKAILADGSVFNSAFSEITGESLSKKFKWGIGPYLNGLFTQSNMGIVTEVTFQLGRKSEHIELAKFSFTDAELTQVVHSVKEILSRYPSLVSGINLMNKERMESMGVLNAPDWTGIFSINADKAIAKVLKKTIKNELKGKAKLQYINKNFIQLLNKIPLPQVIKNDLASAEELLNILEGRPTLMALNLCYLNSPEKKKTFNPALDDCGLIWYSPLVEMDGQSVINYVNFVKETCNRFNIPPLITLTSLSHGVFDSTVPILFSKESQCDEALNAHNCYNALLKDGRDLGFFPYRMGIAHMDYLTECAPNYFKIVENIKKTLDPNGTIAPGRYCNLK